MPAITWDDFEKVELRIGTIIAAEEFPEAHKPAYRLRVDFGPEIGTKQSSAQITDLYGPSALVGRQVLAVVNFPPKRIGGFLSEVLVTGVRRADGAVVLVAPDRRVDDGLKLL